MALLARLLDHQVEAIAALVDRRIDEPDRAEDRVLPDHVDGRRDELGRIRRLCAHLRRHFRPQRAVIQKFAARPPRWLVKADVERLRGIANDRGWLIDEAEHRQERAKMLQEEVGSREAESTGRNLYLLTLYTVVFMPMTLISDTFGMNAGGLPGTEGSASFWCTMLLIAGRGRVGDEDRTGERFDRLSHSHDSFAHPAASRGHRRSPNPTHVTRMGARTTRPLADMERRMHMITLATFPLDELWERLIALQQHALAIELQGEDELAFVHPSRQAAARNLINYLALRQHDIADLQRGLQHHGFSSLGVVQGHVMASIEAVLTALEASVGKKRPALDLSRYPSIESEGADLRAYADDTLGPCASDGAVRIMVTMPSEAAEDPAIIDDLLAQGMTVMRVNCAHDGPQQWAAMIDHLRRAERKRGRACRVSFDLAGPKLRTGPVASGPEVLRLKPARDSLGRVTAPGTIAFSPAAGSDDDDNVTLVPLSLALHQAARPGDVLHLHDARGRSRTLVVDNVGRQSLLCTTDRTVYLTTGTELELRRDNRVVCAGVIGTLPPLDSAIPLQPGDSLVVTRDLSPGQPATLDDDDELVEPARIGCSLPAVFGAARPGHRVLLDDGKFEGIVRETGADWFRLEILRAGRGRADLKAEKGINLPDTLLTLPALTDQDLEALPFVVKHADLVALSFVHDAADIDRLYSELDRLHAPDVGVILKIENQAAFERLPELLITASKRRRIAVMVARGDLGVEIGFERLAEVQEEILWLSEAAQVPVIWATQVLESLAKNGLPSRAEVTDAAMSTRAEAVMLNKGPYIGEAIRFLTDVSRRMARHTSKTFATHTRLSVAASEWLEPDRSSGS
jgi:pyruvate kinase